MPLKKVKSFTPARIKEDGKIGLPCFGLVGQPIQEKKIVLIKKLRSIVRSILIK